METTSLIDGITFTKMINAGAANLQAKSQVINNLNVFPIPDGDTGDNMLLTVLGGSKAVGDGCESIADASRRVADGMLLSARGNSGVILSQFFDGIAEGFESVECADTIAISNAFKCGVKHAYNAVIEPTEGTILTVARNAAQTTSERNFNSPEELISCFITEARSTLDKTPEMLPVLKKAGVVDSGGAGLVLIIEGMLKALSADYTDMPTSVSNSQEQDIDLSLFDENSVLEYGYCTELLLRLQTIKTNPNDFDVSIITDYLGTIGDSVVAFKTGSIIKIHVHTMTPDKVLSFCQKYGEFLKIKIENMSLQHNNISSDNQTDDTTQNEERKDYGVVAVCSGEGVKQFFTERGTDVIVDGGQSMNPSTEDFLNAFSKVNADTILVLPNNSNIILTAKQAAEMYENADVRVIESRTIGDGYAALSMLDTDSGDTDFIVQSLFDAMEGVVTASVSKSVRDTDETVEGHYIGFVGKDILCDNEDRFSATTKTIDCAGFADFDICILVYGKDANEDEAKRIEEYIHSNYKRKEVYIIDGKQDVYDYVIIME